MDARDQLRALASIEKDLASARLKALRLTGGHPIVERIAATITFTERWRSDLRSLLGPDAEAVCFGADAAPLPARTIDFSEEVI